GRLHQLHRQGGLARTGEAVRDGEKATRWRGAALRQLQVAQEITVAGDVGVDLRRRRLAHQVHLGPHQRVVAAVQGKQGQAGVVAPVLEVVVEQTVTERTVAPRLQVHHQEGDFGDGVHHPELTLELDAVEQADLPLPACDVAEVEVAVALPYPALP